MEERIQSFGFRLWPTAAQAEQLGQIAGACRYVYNLALEQRRDWWRQYQRCTGRHISYFGQSDELTALRQEVDWIAAVPRHALDASLADLQRSYDAFFAGRAGYPTMRKRSQGCGFAARGRDVSLRKLNAKWADIRLPKVGWVRLRLTRPLIGTPKIVSVREVAGHWQVSIACKVECERIPAPGQVGIDRGVANTLALSTGELLQLPSAITHMDHRRRRAQRILARRVRGSRRRLKARQRVAALHARARRMRTDWLHRVSTRIVRQNGLVAVEALAIKNMTASAAGTMEAPGKGVAQKRGLNRSILAQSWGHFERMLAYKLDWSGGALVRVRAAYSSQTCSACGVIDPRSRERQAVFACVACGHRDHADTNAAKEILRRSTSELLVEGARQRPREARTMGVAA